VVTEVQYDLTATDKTAVELKGIVENAIDSYSSTNLERFGNDFRFSRFVNAIDDSDPAIVSNETEVRMIKRLFPKTFALNTFDINFGNQLHPSKAISENDPVIQSSGFTWISEDSVEFPFSYIRDNGAGKLEVYTTINGVDVVLDDSLGTVDHVNGTLKIVNLLVAEYGDYISIYAIPLKRDIIMNENKIVSIEAADVDVTIVAQSM
jgi:hypothetical protein